MTIGHRDSDSRGRLRPKKESWMSSFNPTVIIFLNVRINVRARTVPPISKYKKDPKQCSGVVEGIA
jgi:hypothetical protein